MYIKNVVSLMIVIIYLTGCQNVTLKDRYGNNGKDNINSFFKYELSQGEQKIRDSLVNSFIKGYDNEMEKMSFEGSYNLETVANEFLLFSIASDNAYLANTEESDKNCKKSWDRLAKSKESRSGYCKNFTVEVYDPNWEFKERIPDLGAGLAYDYYFNSKGSDNNALLVMVAYRGSEGEWKDWIIGNVFPEFYEWIGLKNQHQLALKGFKEIREKAELKIRKIKLERIKTAQEDPHKNTQDIEAERQKTIPIYYYVTGHSLGGALARYIAEAYPDVSAITFNASPRTLAHHINPRTQDGYIIDIVENNDELRLVSKHIFHFSFDDTRKKYFKFDDFNMNETLDGFGHSLDGMAVGMARMAAERLQKDKHENKEYEEYREYQIARDIYCCTYGVEKNGNVDEVCK